MKEKLRTLFQQWFNPKDYRKTVLENLLHAQQLLNEPQFLEETNDGDRIYGLGYLTDADGKQIGLYYTDVVSGDVRRKRVGFRQMMKSYVKYGADAAIAVFADKEHWRLSYMSDLKGGETSAKRFSYILGDPNGQYNTPVNRLALLGTQAPRLRLSDIRDAFSVDALSKEFFDEYHRHYDFIVKELERQGNSGALYHDYVKKMLGRIVFLHFLQKKGWLDGNQTFLRDLFFMQPFDRRADFLEKVLEPLFFGIFNTEPQNREKVFSEHNWDLSLLNEWNGGSTNALTHSYNHALPYLNGGLFEEDAVDKLHIKLPGSLFEDLFTFLASYNFTVDENDPDDAEVGVDPEMLGKIFESLLEDNKAKGAFYTPKEIVRYMCKESLIAYLSSCVSKSPCPAGRDLVNLINSSDSVGNDSPTADGVNNLQDSQDFASETSRSIRRFVETHEMQPELEPYRDTLDSALRNVKICDPAIGSGAFPMGLLNELWRCREALYSPSPAGRDLVNLVDSADASNCKHGNAKDNLQDQRDFVSAASRSKLKKEIIENNIYGVDIERGAIDIARLRFWLSIVVDAEEPEPLPNFDYKFMQGNSLIESYKGIDLSRISNRLPGGQSKSTQLLLGLDSDFSKKNLQRLMRDYFSVTDHKQKASMRQAINDEVKHLITDFIGGTAHDLDTLDPSANQDFFLWHTWFKDIFDNGGFDIVIGNPPYIKEYENSNVFEHLKTGKYYKAKMDIWFYFACCAIDILKKEGSLSFIAQPQWRMSDAASILRNKICDECRLIYIMDFGTYMVFENACTQAMIMSLYKTEMNTYEFKFKLNNDIISNPKELDDFLTSSFSVVEFDKQTYRDTLFSFSTDSSVSKIIGKIRKKANFTIDKNKEIIQGIIGSPDEAFKLKEADISSFSSIEKRYIKPFHTSTNRYYTPHEDLFLLYLTDKNISHVSNEKYPSIYKKLMPYRFDLENRREVLNGRKSWFSLWWERDESFFLPGPKIIFAARTMGRNFTYTEDEFYASRNCFFIKCKRMNLKYLVALLNSTLMFFFMHQTLKHNGELLQLDKVQFLNVPLFIPSVEKQNSIIHLVEQIIYSKKNNVDADTSHLEDEIDKLVYQLYNLTPEEIAIIEQNN